MAYYIKKKSGNYVVGFVDSNGNKIKNSKFRLYVKRSILPSSIEVKDENRELPFPRAASLRLAKALAVEFMLIYGKIDNEKAAKINLFSREKDALRRTLSSKRSMHSGVKVLRKSGDL